MWLGGGVAAGHPLGLAAVAAPWWRSAVEVGAAVALGHPATRGAPLSSTLPNLSVILGLFYPPLPRYYLAPILPYFQPPQPWYYLAITLGLTRGYNGLKSCPQILPSNLAVILWLFLPLISPITQKRQHPIGRASCVGRGGLSASAVITVLVTSRYILSATRPKRSECLYIPPVGL